MAGSVFTAGPQPTESTPVPSGVGRSVPSLHSSPSSAPEPGSSPPGTASSGSPGDCNSLSPRGSLGDSLGEVGSGLFDTSVDPELSEEDYRRQVHSRVFSPDEGEGDGQGEGEELFHLEGDGESEGGSTLQAPGSERVKSPAQPPKCLADELKEAGMELSPSPVPEPFRGENPYVNGTAEEWLPNDSAEYFLRDEELSDDLSVQRTKPWLLRTAGGQGGVVCGPNRVTNWDVEHLLENLKVITFLPFLSPSLSLLFLY